MTNNSYKLNWIPDLSSHSGSLYLKILSALKEDIRKGKLKVGMRLPPQRILAYALNVNLGTVHKAYAAAVKHGLISGEVGRGSYVKGESSSIIDWPNENPYSRLIDFSDNFPCTVKDEKILRTGLQTLSETAFLPALFQYQQNSAKFTHKEIGCVWLRRLRIETTPENLLITVGALHAGFISLMCLARPGDLILTEDFTSQAIKGAASHLKLRIKGITTDKNGILSEELEEILKKEKVAAVYLVPNLQNPTTATIPLKRRKKIANILQKYNVPLIEDDVFGALLDDIIPPISSFMPDNAFYMTSLSKALAPALRVGYLVVPKKYTDIALSVLRTTVWMASPIMIELASRWITDGSAEKLLTAQKKEIARRKALAEDFMQGFDMQNNLAAPHLWLKLPEPWRDSVLTALLKKKEVAVIPAFHFATSRSNATHAVRLCLGTPPSILQVKEGLEIICDTLKNDLPFY